MDEAYFGDKGASMINAERKEQTGRGTAGKSAVVGIKDRGTKQVRAEIVEATDGSALRGFVERNAQTGAIVYTEEARAYQDLPMLYYSHESVQHGVSEYVRDIAYMKDMESFWSMSSGATSGSTTRSDRSTSATMWRISAVGTTSAVPTRWPRWTV